MTNRAETPDKIYLVAIDSWTNNDEWSYIEGEGRILSGGAFFVREHAQAHANAMNARWYAHHPTPASFNLDPNDYDTILDPDAYDDWTWDDVINAGWSDPYEVIEMELGDSMPGPPRPELVAPSTPPQRRLTLPSASPAPKTPSKRRRKNT